jgi:hypothetical protein
VERETGALDNASAVMRFCMDHGILCNGIASISFEIAEYELEVHPGSSSLARVPVACDRFRCEIAFQSDTPQNAHMPMSQLGPLFRSGRTVVPWA